MPAFPPVHTALAHSRDTLIMPRVVHLPMKTQIKRRFDTSNRWDVQSDPVTRCGCYGLNTSLTVLYPGPAVKRFLRILEQKLCDGSLSIYDFRYFRQVLTLSNLHYAFIVPCTIYNDIELPEWMILTPSLLDANGCIGSRLYNALVERAEKVINSVRIHLDRPMVSMLSPHRFTMGSWFKFTATLRDLRTITDKLSLVRALGIVQRAIVEGFGYVAYVDTFLETASRQHPKDFSPMARAFPEKFMGGWGNKLDAPVLHWLLDCGVPLWLIHDYTDLENEEICNNLMPSWSYVSLPEPLTRDNFNLIPPSHQKLNLHDIWYPIPKRVTPSFRNLSSINAQLALMPPLGREVESSVASAYQPSLFSTIATESGHKLSHRWAVICPPDGFNGTDADWTSHIEVDSCRGVYKRVSSHEWNKERELHPDDVWYDREHGARFIFRFPFIHILPESRNRCMDAFGQPFTYSQVLFISSANGQTVDGQRPRWLYHEPYPPSPLPQKPPHGEEVIATHDDVATHYPTCTILIPLRPTEYLSSSDEENSKKPQSMWALPSSVNPAPTRHPLYHEWKVKFGEDRATRRAGERTAPRADTTADTDSVAAQPVVLSGKKWSVARRGLVIPGLADQHYHPIPTRSIIRTGEDGVLDVPEYPFLVRFTSVQASTTVADWIALVISLLLKGGYELLNEAEEYNVPFQMITAFYDERSRSPAFYCGFLTAGYASYVLGQVSGKVIDGKEVHTRYVRYRQAHIPYLKLNSNQLEAAKVALEGPRPIPGSQALAPTSTRGSAPSARHDPRSASGTGLYDGRRGPGDTRADVRPSG